MTAVRTTLEETRTKEDVGYGAMEDTTTLETTPKTRTRTTIDGMLLFVMSVVLVIAGAATRSSLRSETTASMVVSSERDHHHRLLGCIDEDTASSVVDPCAAASNNISVSSVALVEPRAFRGSPFDLTGNLAARGYFFGHGRL